MGDSELPDIDYGSHEQVRRLVDVLRYCLEEISLGFEDWEKDHLKGPGLYVAVVASTSLREYADAMGNNRWPIDRSHNVFDDVDAFNEAAERVAVRRDGAVVISVDGEIQEQMVRFKYVPPSHRPDAQADNGVEYAGWMGSRHMSAADTSARTEVVATLTLSEENGRVTVFRDGRYDDTTWDELGGRWRVDPA